MPAKGDVPQINPITTPASGQILLSGPFKYLSWTYQSKHVRFA